MLLPVGAPPVWIHMSGSGLVATGADQALQYAAPLPPLQSQFLVNSVLPWLRVLCLCPERRRLLSCGAFFSRRCSGRVDFMGSAPPFGFRRLTQESAVASTVALFQAKTEQNPAELDMSACILLAQLLQRAEASVLLPNFVEAEFNDNDGARLMPRLIATAAAANTS